MKNHEKTEPSEQKTNRCGQGEMIHSCPREVNIIDLSVSEVFVCSCVEVWLQLFMQSEERSIRHHKIKNRIEPRFDNQQLLFELISQKDYKLQNFVLKSVMVRSWQMAKINLREG